jgi:predicted P-loop ATPase
MGVILSGIQGQAKSGAIAAMVPDRSLFCEIAFNYSDENLARKMRGKLVVEVPELRGLHTRDNEGIKSFMTRSHEQWTPKYKEFTTAYGRRSLIYGTSNEDEIFADKTGNRRWLPIKCGPEIDFSGIAVDRDQLWAEGAALFNAKGIQWSDAQRLAAYQHSDFAVTDVWTDEVAAWLDAEDIDGSRNGDRKFLTTHMMLTQCIRIEVSRITRKDEIRMAGVLRAMKFERIKVRDGNATPWGFVRSNAGTS